MINNTIVPENNRIAVKLAASIASLSKASRHNTELAAKAINAMEVLLIALISEL